MPLSIVDPVRCKIPDVLYHGTTLFAARNIQARGLAGGYGPGGAYIALHARIPDAWCTLDEAYEVGRSDRGNPCVILEIVFPAHALGRVLGEDEHLAECRGWDVFRCDPNTSFWTLLTPIANPPTCRILDRGEAMGRVLRTLEATSGKWRPAPRCESKAIDLFQCLTTRDEKVVRRGLLKAGVKPLVASRRINTAKTLIEAGKRFLLAGDQTPFVDTFPIQS
jgi:hypothetical protein